MKLALSNQYAPLAGRFRFRATVCSRSAGAIAAAILLGLFELVCATSARTQQPPAPANTLGRELAATCAPCHGTNGFSAGGMPSIAGRDRETLVLQLQLFRSGKRPGTVMGQIARGFTDQEIALLTEFFASQGR